MEKKIPSLILLLALLAALWILSACSQTSDALPLSGAAALHAQIVTPTPPAEDHSEIGSTSGILIMGVIIAVISTLPVLVYRKRK